MMLSPAKTLFFEKTGRTWGQANSSPWPLLSQLQAIGWLSTIDILIAQTVIQTPSPWNESFAALMAYLSLISRQGHIALKIDEGAFFPSVEKIIDVNQLEEHLPLRNEFKSLIEKGLQEIPLDLVEEAQCQTTPWISKPVCRYRQFLYLQKFWALETLFLQHFERCLKQKLEIEVDTLALQQELALLQERQGLEAQQALAIKQAACCHLTFILGGPGTGKTYTAGLLISLLVKHARQKKSVKIALAAPTGKAASHLQASIEKHLIDCDHSIHLQAATLHRLLGKSNFANAYLHQLDFDLILVDESSMIDISLMTSLFCAVKPGARLIFLGDPHQLPPVEAGMLFKEMTEFLKNRTTPYSPIMLQKCLRIESQEMVEFVQAVCSGKKLKFDQSLQSIKIEHKLEASLSTRQLLQDLIALLEKYYGHLEQLDAQAIYFKFQQFRVLNPLRQGELGTEILNKLLFQYFFSHRKERFYAPILMTKNDYQLELFNGDTGVICFAKYESPYAEFWDSKQKTMKRYPLDLLTHFEYAYCLTVHQSQGSEFDHVLFLVPPMALKFGRELFYTGITRAKKRLTIWTKKDILNELMEKTEERICGLSVRFEDAQLFD